MTAPERRRPLPALAFIAALTVLTAIVWFRVIHRPDKTVAQLPPCPKPTKTSTTVSGLKVLPVPSKVTITVLNSTQRSGFAKSSAKLLKAKGFKIDQTDDDDQSYGGHGVIKSVGEIRYGPTAKAAATLLKYYVPNAKYVPTDTSNSIVLFALGAKFSKTELRTIAQVKSLLRNNGVTLTRGALPTPSPTPTPSATCTPRTADTSDSTTGATTGTGGASGSAAPS